MTDTRECNHLDERESLGELSSRQVVKAVSNEDHMLRSEFFSENIELEDDS